MKIFDKKLGYSGAIIANYMGALWAGFIGIITAPLYYRLLGMSEWGIIAACMGLQAVFFLLDSGISQLVVRNVSVAQKNETSVSKVVSSMFFVYLCMGIVLFIIMYFAIPEWISGYLKINDSENAYYVLVARVLAGQYLFQYLNSCFVSVYHGTNKQAEINYINSKFVTMKHVISLVSIYFFDFGVGGYVFSFMFVSLFEFISNLAKMMTRHDISTINIDFGFLKVFLNEFGVLTIVIFLGALVSQLDKLILPGLAGTKIYGQYALISTIGLAFNQLQYPIMRTALPMRAAMNGPNLIERKKIAKTVTVMCGVPVIAVLFFAPVICSLWLGAYNDINEYATVLRCVALSTLINAYYGINYIEFVVENKLRYILIINLMNLFIVLFLLMNLYEYIGVVAGGYAWLIASFVQLLISWVLTRRQLVL